MRSALSSNATTDLRCVISDFSHQLKYLEDIKREKKGVIGYFSDYVPEEIIFAGGFHPYQFFNMAGSIESRSLSIQGPCCSFIKSISKRGINKTSIIDGFIFTNICDSLRHLQLFWKNGTKNKFIETINNPVIVDNGSIEFFAKELRRFSKSFEVFFKIRIKDSEIEKAVKICNKNRK